MEPRNGGGIGRVGLLGRLRGRRFAQDKLDFRSNVDRVEDEAVVASKLVAARK